MSARNITQRELADRMGVTPAVVSLMLNGKQQSSKLVEPISAFLCLELPPLDLQDPQIARLSDAANGLPPEDIEALIAMADHYKSRK